MDDLDSILNKIEISEVEDGDSYISGLEKLVREKYGRGGDDITVKRINENKYRITAPLYRIVEHMLGRNNKEKLQNFRGIQIEIESKKAIRKAYEILKEDNPNTKLVSFPTRVKYDFNIQIDGKNYNVEFIINFKPDMIIIKYAHREFEKNVIYLIEIKSRRIRSPNHEKIRIDKSSRLQVLLYYVLTKDKLEENKSYKKRLKILRDLDPGNTKIKPILMFVIYNNNKEQIEFYHINVNKVLERSLRTHFMEVLKEIAYREISRKENRRKEAKKTVFNSLKYIPTP